MNMTGKRKKINKLPKVQTYSKQIMLQRKVTLDLLPPAKTP